MTICQICGRARSEDDEDYSPLQFLMTRPLGWYSGDDGEICGLCMKDLTEEANRV